MPDFTMPSLGADMDAGTLVEWLVHEGDTVHRGDPIAVVDTDKSAIEVESFHDGVVQAFLVEPGTRVTVGTPLASLAPVGAPAAATRAASTTASPAAPTTPTAAAPAPPRRRAGEVGKVRRPAPPPRIPQPREPSPAEPSPRKPSPSEPSPAVAPPLRHHAAELGVDLTKVSGTGPHGQVTRADVDRAAQAATRRVPAEPAADRAEALAAASEPTTPRPRVSPYARRLARELEVDLAQVRGTGAGGSVRAEDVLGAVGPAGAPPETAPAEPSEAAPETAAERESATAQRATIAALMARAKREIPHYYVATTVDLRALDEWLRRTNKERPVRERIVPAAALLKAAALALREVPELNGFWTDGRFVPGDDVHLGVAVSVRGGALVAPAIHHTADLTLPEVMASLRDLVARARAGRLRRSELADPTFTVSDLGDQGVEEVIGVIYPPQVALLGVGRIVPRPWADGAMIGVRPTVRLTLSGDHRATDGAMGARFLNALERLLQEPEEL